MAYASRKDIDHEARIAKIMQQDKRYSRRRKGI
jgi:hypothetical protein